MSTTIDQRVVEMRFDNQQFESGVQASLSTLDKLKQSLNLEGASRGLENVGTAAKNVNFSDLSNSVDSVKLKFSAFEVMAVTALANITNSAINAGKQLISAFTFEPIQTGFDEFELKMGSVQTIMASTGESLETVNGYLDELNKYSDQTIYSFSDMTSNIGKFTNAGVKLEDAVLAIKGISNEAAVSGANANEASRAMYNFAQALSAGYVKLIDWKSIENANMATVEFKTQLLEAAVASGTVAKTADGMYTVLSTNAKGQKFDSVIDATKNFNDSLSYQWMTTEVLVNTLRDYADETTEIGKKAYAAAQDVKTFSMMMDTLKEAAQSGWATTWELIVGDFNEGKALWTELSQAFGNLIEASSNARNEILKGWNELGGRDTLIQSFRNLFNALANIIMPVKEAFREFFPRTTSEQLYSFTEGIQNFTRLLIPSIETTEKLKRTFRGLFAVLDIVSSAFKTVLRAFTPLLKSLLGANSSILDITASWGDWLVKLNKSIKQSRVFENVMSAISTAVQFLARKLSSSVSVIKSWVDAFLQLEVVQKAIAVVKNKFEDLKKYLANDFTTDIKALVVVLHNSVSTIKSWVDAFLQLEVVQKAIAVVKNKFEDLKSLFARGVSVENLVGTLKTGFEKIQTFVSGGITAIKNFVEYVKSLDDISLNNISDVFGYFKDNVVSYFVNIDDAVEKTKSVLSGFGEKVNYYFELAGKGITAFREKVSEFIKFFSEKFDIGLGEILTVGAGAGIIIGITKLGKALEALSGPLKEFCSVLSGISKLLKSVSKYYDAKAFKEKSQAFVNLALSIGILASALILLTKYADPTKLDTALITLAALDAAFIATYALLRTIDKLTGKTGGNGVKLAETLIALAAGVKVLSSSLSLIKDIDYNAMISNGNLGKFLVLLGSLVAALGVLSKVAPKLSVSAITLLSLASSMKILVSALQEIDGLEWANLKESLVILATFTAFLGALSLSASKIKPGSAVGLLAVVAALKIFIGVFNELATMEGIDSADGVIHAIQIVLSEIATLIVLSCLAGKNADKAGVMILGVSAAIVAISGLMLVINEMTLGQIAQAAAVIGGLLTAFYAIIKVSQYAGQWGAKAATMLLAMSGALVVLTGVIVILKHLTPDGLGQALGTIGLLSGCFAALIAVTNMAKDCSKTLIVLTATIGALALAVGALSMISDQNAVITATECLAVLMGMFALIVSSTSYVKESTATIAVLTGAVVALGGVLAILANQPIDSAITAAVALGVLAVALSGSMALLSLCGDMSPNILASAASLVAMASALAILTPAIYVLGNMSVGEIGKALLALTSAFVGLYVASIAFGTITPLIAALAGAVTLLGVGALACGGGVLALAAGIAILAETGVAGVEPLMLAIQSLISMIPSIVTAFGQGVLALLTLFANSTDQFVSSVSQIITAVCTAIIDTITNVVPQILGLIATIFGSILDLIKELIPQLCDAVLTIITECTSIVAEHIPDLIQSGIEIVLAMINGMADGIRNNKDAIRDAFFNMCEAILETVLAFFGIHSPSTVFAEIGGYLIDGLVNGLKEFFSDPIETIKELASGMVEGIKGRVNGFVEGGKDVISGLGEGVSKLSSTPIAKIKEIAGNMVDGVKERASKFTESGKELVENLKRGVESAKDNAVNGITTITENMHAGITGFVDKFQNAGSDLIDYLAKGIDSKDSDATSVITDLVSSFLDKFESKKSEFIDTGKHMVSGLIKGLASKMSDVVDKAKEIAKKSTQALKDELGVASPSKVWTDIGKNEALGLIKGKTSMLSQVIASSKEVGNADTKSLSDTIKDGTKTIGNTLTDRVGTFKDYWGMLTGTAAEGASALGTINNALGLNESAALEQEAELSSKSVANAKSTASAKKAVKEQEILDESDYWQRLLLIRKQGQDAEKYKDTTFAEFQKEIVEETTSTIKEYTDAVNSNTDALMNRAGIFSEVSEVEKVYGSDLQKNLKEQYRQMQDFYELLTELNTRITSEGLKSAINQMGVDSIAELSALNEMTDVELTEYADLYDQKYALCQEIAKTQLQNVKTETESKLSELYGGAQVNLEQFSQSFNGTFESIRSYVGESIKIGSELASGVAQGISEGTDQSKTAATEMIKETEAAAKEAADIHSPSGLFRDEVGKNITAGIAEGMSSPESLSLVKESAAELNTAILESFTESNEQFLTAGEEIINACNTGMNSSSDSFTSQCTETIRTALTAMQTSINNSQTSFQTAASGIMSSFVAGVKSKEIESKSLITNVISGCLTAINNKQTQFHTAGSTLMIKLIGGIKSKDAETQNAIFVIVKACLKKIEDKYFDFRNAGTEAVAHFAAGIKSSESKVEKEFTDLLSVTINTIRGRYKDFSDAGDYLVRGFAAGIDDSTFRAEAAARAMARAAIDAAEEELDENSPSKEGRRIGDYFGLGFVNGIAEYADKAYGVSSDMAGKAKSGLTNAISEIQSMLESGIDTEPTIRPVLDLSDVESKSLRLNSLFSSSMAVRVSNGMNAYRSGNIQNGETTRSSGNSFVFTQNNYSPKALSRSDIYRQTKNQFSAMERMVEV